MHHAPWCISAASREINQGRLISLGSPHSDLFGQCLASSGCSRPGCTAPQCRGLTCSILMLRGSLSFLLVAIPTLVSGRERERESVRE